MARILITGAMGFAGRTLVDILSPTGDELFAAHLAAEASTAGDAVRSRCRLIRLDILDQAQLADVLEQVRPQQIYHLAALVPIRASLDHPERAMNVNVIGTANLLEAVRRSGLRPRVLVPGSSEEYGLIHPHETPVTEDQPLRPTNPYGVSKAAQMLLAVQFARTWGMDIVCGRPFNMTGPGQTTDYACPTFARQVAMIENGLAEPVLHVGNISARRDYNDVRDILRACTLLMAHGRPGQIYNLCRGEARSMSDIIDSLLAMSKVAIEVRPDRARFRPVENMLVLGSNRKLVDATGYQPRYSFDQTLADVLNYWRAHVRHRPQPTPHLAAPAQAVAIAPADGAVAPLAGGSGL